MSIVSLLILILFFIICIFVKFYTIQPSSCNSITNKLSIYLSISLFCDVICPCKKNLQGMPDVRPKIHTPTTSPIKSWLKSVLGVRSSYVERNNYPEYLQRPDTCNIKVHHIGSSCFLLKDHDIRSSCFLWKDHDIRSSCFLWKDHDIGSSCFLLIGSWYRIKLFSIKGSWYRIKLFSMKGSWYIGSSCFLLKDHDIQM